MAQERRHQGNLKAQVQNRTETVAKVFLSISWKNWNSIYSGITSISTDWGGGSFTCRGPFTDSNVSQLQCMLNGHSNCQIQLLSMANRCFTFAHLLYSPPHLFAVSHVPILFNAICLYPLFLFPRTPFCIFYLWPPIFPHSPSSWFSGFISNQILIFPLPQNLSWCLLLIHDQIVHPIFYLSAHQIVVFQG